MLDMNDKIAIEECLTKIKFAEYPETNLNAIISNDSFKKTQ